MSRDKSLKSGGVLSKHNNVLPRAERINILKDQERWSEGKSPFGLPKVAHRKVTVGGKAKKKEETAAEGAAAPTADAKAAAPAAATAKAPAAKPDDKKKAK